MNSLDLLNSRQRGELLEFTQNLVRTRSFSGQEGQVIRLLETRLKDLGFDEVVIDSMGNLLGRIGAGDRSILFDSHVDVVAVNDQEEWALPPFVGDIVGGRLHGRGSVDMKSGAAASLYAAVIARQLGFTEGKTVYVSFSVFEEDCDGENLKHLFKETGLRPEAVVICEPSENTITLGHKGKAQIAIKTYGVSAHGSAPEKGVNAVYEMAEIIQRIEARNLALTGRAEPHGSLVLSRISSQSASLNAVPSECEVYLDRRTVPGESDEDIRREMDALVRGKNADWQIGTLHRTSWTGLEFDYEPFHTAWKIDLDHELARACLAAYRATYHAEPGEFGFWDFSTNAVAPVSLGIPTIGFGPGDPKLAHMRDESCEVEQILDACRFYIQLIQAI